MRKTVLIAVLAVFTLMAVLALAMGNSFITIPSIKLAAWEETFPVCQQFCKTIGGEYTNHEPIFSSDGRMRMVCNKVNCECEGMGKVSVANFSFDGEKKTYELERVK